jgi:aminotransferase
MLKSILVRVMTPKSEVLVTVGVSEAIDIALRALINPGDKVLYHEPCYVSYAPSIALAFGEAIPVATNPESSFALDPEAFEAGLAAWLQNINAQFPYQSDWWNG